MTAEEVRDAEQRQAWIQHGLGEVHMWLDHAEEKADFIARERGLGRFRYIEAAELVFVVSATINRLAQIALRTEGHIGTKQKLTPWLASQTGWPPPVANAFWSCVRNPVMHMGMTWGFAAYGEETNAGLPILVTVDMSDRRERDSDPGVPFPPGTGPVHSSGPGWLAIHHADLGDPPYDEWSREHVSVNFYIFEVIDVVRSMIRPVAMGLRAASPAELGQLTKLQRRLPFTTSPTLDPRLDV